MSYKITIPAPNLGEYPVPKGQVSFRDQAISIIKKYKRLYGAQFNEASKATNLPVSILVGFAGVEGGGLENEKLTGKNGTPSIMQMSPLTGYQTLKDQLGTEGVTIGSMYPFYKAIPNAFTLKKPLPTNFWASSNIKVRQQEASDYLSLKPIDVVSPMIFNQLIKDVSFAIFLGATHLGQLFLESIEQVGSVRLDHIIIKYNSYSFRFIFIWVRGNNNFSRNFTDLFTNNYSFHIKSHSYIKIRPRIMRRSSEYSFLYSISYLIGCKTANG
jgi:hypothetical protein